MKSALSPVHSSEAMMVTQSQELKAKLQTKGKVRPHKMVCKKMPDGSGAALTELPKRHATGAAAEKAYCDAIDKVSGVFGRQRRSVSTAYEHKQYMRLFEGWLVRKNHGSYVSIVLDEHGMLAEVHAKRSAETGEIKVIPPQMLIGWLLDMAVGSQDTPKGTHASEILARAAQEAATACGKRSNMKRKKGQFGCGSYADEPWSLQAYQKRVYAVSAPRVARSHTASCTEALSMALTHGRSVRACRCATSTASSWRASRRATRGGTTRCAACSAHCRGSSARRRSTCRRCACACASCACRMWCS